MITTIKEIDAIVDDFSKSGNLDNLRSGLRELQREDPVYVPYAIDNDWEILRTCITKSAHGRGRLGVVFSGSCTYRLVNDTLVEIPLFYDLSDGFHILVRQYDSSNPASCEYAEQILYQYLMFVLLSYPLGKVRVNFIDPYFSGKADVFMRELGGHGDESICRLFQGEEEIQEFFSRNMRNRLESVNRQGESYFIDNTSYEIVVLLDYPRGYDRVSKSMEILLENGERCGIQFVVMNDTNPDYSNRYSASYDILANKRLFTQIEANVETPESKPGICFQTNLFFSQEAYRECMNYLSSSYNSGDVEEMKTDFDGFTPIPDIDDPVTPEQYFGGLESCVANNVVVPVLKYNTIRTKSGGMYDVVTNHLYWQTEGNGQKNFVISFTNRSKDHAEDILNELILNMILSLPITKIHCTIVNTRNVPSAMFLNKYIDDILVDEISSDEGARHYYRSLLEKTKADRNQLGCGIETYNSDHQTIYRPYEIVILISPESSINEDVLSLFDNGANSGIYFVVMANRDMLQLYNGRGHLLSHEYAYQEIDADSDCFPGVPNVVMGKAYPFSREKAWRNAATDYINKHSTVVVKHDWDAVIETPYPVASADLAAVIGYEQGTGEPVEFKLDISHSHYHSFVIGGTGSGKTTFLHNIILSMALKYRPEDLEMYLLDLKGPEFGRYRVLQHCGAVLVDKADDKITYEIVASLSRKMDDRSELFGGGGSDLAKYNKLHKEAPLPQILLVVDECQNLFTNNSEDVELTREIVKVIKRIATEGRAYGVHMLLATQSLNNAPNLDDGILSQIFDHFILPCNEGDARLLVTGEHKEIVGREAARMEREKEINRGQCFYQGPDGYKRFKFNYINDAKGEVDNLIQKSVDKASACAPNNQVFFSGRQNYLLSNNLVALKSQHNDCIIASPGQQISFSQAPQCISLVREPGNNILTMGFDDKQYVTRTTIGLLRSLILSDSRSHSNYRFPVINCLGIGAESFSELLHQMDVAGYIETIDIKESGEFLKSLCDDIASGSAKPTVLTILRQEAFLALKNNDPINIEETSANDQLDAQLPDPMDISGTMAMLAAISFDDPVSLKRISADVKTYREALVYILSEGPKHGVHVLLQVNRASELALSKGSFFDRADVFAKFAHLLFLKTDRDSATDFGLNELHLSEMEESDNRLRAYYYNATGGYAELLSPYTLPMKKIPRPGFENRFPTEYNLVLDVENTMDEINKNS